MSIQEGWAHYQEAMGEISSLLGEEVAEMLTASLRAFGLSVLDEVLPDVEDLLPEPEAKYDSILMSLMSMKKRVRAQIERLGLQPEGGSDEH